MVFQREVQVLRARFGEHVEAGVLRGGDLLQRLGGRHVHDVERHVAGDLRQLDRPVRRLGFELDRTR